MHAFDAVTSPVNIELDQAVAAKIKEDMSFSMTSHCVGGTSSIFLPAKYHLTQRRRFYGDLIAPTTKICIWVPM